MGDEDVIEEIENMSDQQKSQLLTTLCGLKQEKRNGKFGFWSGEYLLFDSSPRYDKNGDIFFVVPPSLYHPAYMGVAWVVLNWAQRNMDRVARRALSYIVANYTKSPAEAQRAWLDEVLRWAVGQKMFLRMNKDG